MLITVQPDPNWQLSLAQLSPSLFIYPATPPSPARNYLEGSSTALLELHRGIFTNKGQLAVAGGYQSGSGGSWR